MNDLARPLDRASGAHELAREEPDGDAAEVRGQVKGDEQPLQLPVSAFLPGKGSH